MGILIAKGSALPEAPVIAMLVGPQGSGKTSMACSAPKSVIIATDKRGQRRRIAEPDGTFLVDNWNDVADFIKLKKNLEPFDNVILDHLGGATGLLKDWLSSQPGAMQKDGETPTAMGWGKLSAEFRRFIETVEKHGKNLVILCHSRVTSDPDQNSKAEMLKLRAIGSSTEIALDEADQVGILSQLDSGYYVDFGPQSDGFSTKDPANYGHIMLPNPASEPWMGNLLRDAAEGLKSTAAEQAAEGEAMRDLRNTIASFEDVEGFNEQVAKMKQAPRSHKRLLMDLARGRGFSFDAKSGKFQ